MRKENVKKPKINLMDIVVILLILVCIGSIVLRAVATEEKYSQREYRLHFQIDEIKSSSFEYFDGHSGEIVKIKENGRVIGVLGDEFSRGVAIHTYTEDMEDGTKVEHKVPYPAPKGENGYSEEMCSISGYILVLGNKSNGGIFLDGTLYLEPDQTLEIVTEHITATIRITGVSEK